MLSLLAERPESDDDTFDLIGLRPNVTHAGSLWRRRLLRVSLPPLFRQRVRLFIAPDVNMGGGPYHFHL